MLSEAAAELAVAGWAVFPVNAETKKPRTEHGHLDATTSASVVAGWARRFDDGGAIATPTGSGLLVIDIDPRNGGRVPSWAPETLTVSTQSGGLHLYYHLDQDIKSRAGLFGPGVDSKSSGGYVLIPPSPGYTWAHVRPQASLLAATLLPRMAEDSRERSGHARLAPEKWRQGIIHDQAVAWAAYFADVLEDDAEVIDATWDVIQQARDSGTPIDNAGGHIDTAINWVLGRQGGRDAPALA